MLENIYARLVDEARPKEMVQSMVRMDPDVFDKALEKLWIHGGAIVDAAENLKRGGEGWRELYVAQAEHKLAQIELMIRYTQSSECRMLGLVRHFGDYADAQQRCGICDFCAPGESIAQSFRTASDTERAAAGRIVAGLKKSGRKATGRLHSELFADYSLDRDGFEQVLGAMARAGWVDLTEASFQQDGRRVDYRVAGLTAAGRALDAESVPAFEMKLEIEAAPKRRKKSRVGRREKRSRGREKPAPVAKAAKTAKATPVAAPGGRGKGFARLAIGGSAAARSACIPDHVGPYAAGDRRAEARHACLNCWKFLALARAWPSNMARRFSGFWSAGKSFRGAANPGLILAWVPSPDRYCNLVTHSGVFS